MPGGGAAQGNAAILAVLHHVQAQQQLLRRLILQGEDAAAPAAQPGMLHKVQPGRQLQPRPQQTENAPGQPRALHPEGNAHPSAAPQLQAAGGLHQGAELAHDAAIFAQGQPQQLLLGQG